MKYKNKLEEYKDKINYDVWEDVAHVQGITFNRQPYNIKEVKQIVANMMFNMGRPRLSKFKGMKRGVDAEDWNAAADEMVDSAWYRQVTNRAERLVERMRNV